MDNLTGLDKSWQPPNSTFFHSTDRRWKPNNHEEKLLALFEAPILDIARTHPSFTQKGMAALLASVVVSDDTARKTYYRWKQKAQWAKEALERWPDCEPARNFLKKFQERFGRE